MQSQPLLSFVRWPLALAFALTTTAALAQPSPAPAERACTHCGVVEHVRHVETKGQSSGLGAVAGGVLGGVLGHQIGSGRGNTVATIAGAGAGAYAGNQVEKNRNRKAYWSVAVRMDNGTKRTFSFNDKPGFREGDRIKTLDGGRRLALAAH
ncbi:MAG: glycine zipper 2TM domain-containing protein [Pseudomonadota bacterium]|nr:glycine zipper 2TM domain-containing protein [Pseudomonadota bacterium]